MNDNNKNTINEFDVYYEINKYKYISQKYRDILRSYEYKRYKIKSPFRIIKRCMELIVHPKETIQYFKDAKKISDFNIDNYLRIVEEYNVHKGNVIRHYLEHGRYDHKIVNKLNASNKLDIDYKVKFEPWNKSLKERCELLDRYKAEKYKIVAIIYNKEDSSTFRYRVFNVWESLVNHSEKWRAVYFFENELDMIINNINSIDVLCMARFTWVPKIDEVTKLCNKKGIKIAFDCDDLVFSDKYIYSILYSQGVDLSSANTQKWLGYCRSLEMTAAKADYYISTNEKLSKLMEEYFNGNGYVIPNFINENQIKISESMINNKDEEISDCKLSIGYFSGSTTHAKDFNIVKNQLLELIEDCKDIKVLLVGYVDIDTNMKTYVDEGRLVVYPFVNFIELQKLISSVDFNIVPLVKSELKDCKSELKFFEAAIVKTISVVSPSSVYKSCIEHGVNGFICDDQDWYSLFIDLYNDKYDIDTIRDNAYKYAYENYASKNVARKIENVYDKILNN